MTNQFSHVQQFKYLGILIQEFHVRVDTGLLSNLVGLFEESAASEEEQVHHFLIFLLKSLSN